MKIPNGYAITNLDDAIIVAGVTHCITKDTYKPQVDWCTGIDKALTGTGITVTCNTELELYQFRSQTAFTLQTNSTLLAFITFDNTIKMLHHQYT